MAQIHGIWFYEASDLDKVGSVLKKIKTGLPKADVLPQPNAVQVRGPAGQGWGSGRGSTLCRRGGRTRRAGSQRRAPCLSCLVDAPMFFVFVLWMGCRLGDIYNCLASCSTRDEKG